MSLREKVEQERVSNKWSEQHEQSTETMQETIIRLAALHHLEYDKVRQDEAAKLGISRVSELDKAVTNARKPANKDNAPFADIEPWPEKINPANLLDEISKTIIQFIVMDKYQAAIAALWVAAIWFIAVIHTAPIALANAPEKACGKTQFLTLLCKLALRATQLSGISPSVLFRMIEKYQPTLFIDEIETVLKDNEELRGLLNAGHTKDSATVWRNTPVGDDFEPTPFNVYGFKAIAGIKATNLAETITSRAIVFELRRKKPDEKVERLRHAEPGLFERLTAQLARFAQDYSEQVKQTRPILPEELGDREQDNIEPLLQIAHVAGGHWPETATKAALKIYQTSQSPQSTANELLSDIQEIFEARRIDRIKSVDLIEALTEDEEKSWATYNRGKKLSFKQLANQLKAYGIESKSVRFPYETRKGFKLEQFTDTFERYLAHTPLTPPILPSQSNISLKANTRKDSSVTDDLTEKTVSRHTVTNVTANEVCDGTQKRKVTLKPLPAKDCDGVTGETPLEEKWVRI